MHLDPPVEPVAALIGRFIACRDVVLEEFVRDGRGQLRRGGRRFTLYRADGYIEAVRHREQCRRWPVFLEGMGQRLATDGEERNGGTGQPDNAPVPPDHVITIAQVTSRPSRQAAANIIR